MSPHTDTDLRPMPEQITYANILSTGAWLGIAVMFITYGIYCLGVLDPHVDLALVTSHWDKSVTEYIEITSSPHGWAWLSLLGTGDFLNFIGIALLALMTIVCYLTLLPGYYRRKDWPYFTIAVLEILVLTVAASGILGSGGH